MATHPDVQQWLTGQPPRSAVGQRAMLDLLQAELGALHALFCAAPGVDRGTDDTAMGQADADPFDNMPV